MQLDLTEVKQLQGRDMYLSKLLQNVNLSHHDKTPYILDEYGIVYRKVWDRPNIFYAMLVPKNLQPYLCYECHNALAHNGSLCDKAIDIKGNSRKVRCASIQCLQLLYPTDHVLTHLLDMTSFEQTTKCH